MSLGKKKNDGDFSDRRALSCLQPGDLVVTKTGSHCQPVNKGRSVTAAAAAAGLQVEPELSNVSPLLIEKRRRSIVFPTGFEHRV